MEEGIVSVLAITAEARRIEVGIIGREGVTGSALLLGAPSAPYQTFVQVAGSSRAISWEQLKEVIDRSAQLHHFLLRFVQAFTVQTAHTALANGSNTIEERLARWLLMCHDRTDGDELHLTHEFLSLMLAVRRSGVTVTVQTLEGAGFIKARRSQITIRNRAGLEEVAGDCYGTPEAEYERLFGRPLRRAGAPAVTA
jgi:CRP-like cAMP-binding protein